MKGAIGKVRGQAALMEYIVLLFMIVLVIMFVIFLVFGFQFMTLGSGKAQEAESRSLFTIQSMLSSGALSSPNYHSISVLDDAKLTALSQMECEEFEALFGPGVFVNVSLYVEKPDCTGLPTSQYWECTQEAEEKSEMQGTVCTDGTYPGCGTWVFCEDSREERMVYRSVAVNVYRKMENRLELGVLTIAVPADGGAA